MDIRLIKAPSAGALEILKHRSNIHWPIDLAPDAVGLVQGKLIDMVCASDIAEKASGVFVTDIRGNCPQNMVMLMVAGDTAAVEEALTRIQQNDSARRFA